MRTESRYLGPAGATQRPKGIIGKALALMAANMLTDEERGALAAERFAERVDAYQRELFGETAAERADRERQAFLDGLHDRFGLSVGPRNPTPADKMPESAEATKESPSDIAEGQDASDPSAPDGSE